MRCRFDRVRALIDCIDCPIPVRVDCPCRSRRSMLTSRKFGIDITDGWHTAAPHHLKPRLLRHCAMPVFECSFSFRSWAGANERRIVDWCTACQKPSRSYRDSWVSSTKLSLSIDPSRLVSTVHTCGDMSRRRHIVFSSRHMVSMHRHHS